MLATIRSFKLPKAGNDPSDYEDAFWPRKPFDLNSPPIRLAIGDGATEASFSALWARLLVREYGLGRLTAGSMQTCLPSIQSRWRRLVGREPLPWYAEEKLRDGAFSSLLGLTIGGDSHDNGSGGCWEALAIGDSCLFQIRGEDLIARFPLEKSELFDSRPVLVPSVVSQSGRLNESLKEAAGRWEEGDVFYLMTDALARWFLKRCELRNDPLFCLNEIKTQDDFDRLIHEQRMDATDDGARILKNDDVTLIRCSIRSPE